MALQTSTHMSPSKLQCANRRTHFAKNMMVGIFLACTTLSVAPQCQQGWAMHPTRGVQSARQPIGRASRIHHNIARQATATSGGLFDNLFRLPEMVSDVLEDVQDLFGQELLQLAPTPMSTVQMSNDGISRSGLLQTMSIHAEAGSERRLARQISRLVEASSANPAVTTVAASQSKEDPCDFVVFFRYKSDKAMMTHQSSNQFTDLLNAMERHLSKPIGLYITDENLGQIGMARHPFGPGGEGGRDDAIYSSRKQ